MCIRDRYCIEARKLTEIMALFSLKDRTKFKERYLKPLLAEGILAMTFPENPTHRNQSYKTTLKGKLQIMTKK